MKNVYQKLLIMIVAICCITTVNAMSKQALAQDQAIQALCDTNYYQASSIGVILNTSGEKNSPKLFFIKNNTNFSILVDKANKGNKGMSAGWASEIDKGRWSALLLNDTGAFNMYCSRTIGNRQKLLDCNKFITVCHAAQVSYKDQPNGSGWVTENQKAKDFLPALEKRGTRINSK